MLQWKCCINCMGCMVEGLDALSWKTTGSTPVS